jgi:hypothetical protein
LCAQVFFKISTSVARSVHVSCPLLSTLHRPFLEPFHDPSVDVFLAAPSAWVTLEAVVCHSTRRSSPWGASPSPERSGAQRNGPVLPTCETPPPSISGWSRVTHAPTTGPCLCSPLRPERQGEQTKRLDLQALYDDHVPGWPRRWPLQGPPSKVCQGSRGRRCKVRSRGGGKVGFICVLAPCPASVHRASLSSCLPLLSMAIFSTFSQARGGRRR